MSHPPPRLSVSTQAGPSTSAPSSTPPSTIGRRPMGARRRAGPGLFVANPDNSDHETSPTKTSPVTASSSSSGRLKSAISTGSAGNLSFAGLSLDESPRSLPSIPEPLASISHPPAQPLTSSSAVSLPPQPPPQPERHIRRAFTTPAPPHDQRPHETRHASSSGAAPSSPTRALPRPSASPSHASPPPSDLRPLPTPTPRVASPEDAMTPAATSDSGRSVMMDGRARSGSTSSQKTLLQVTTDNEQFTLVDITGMHTSDAIRERIFSRLRFRDDEYPNLNLKQTEFGEDPHPNTLTPEGLVQLVQSQGDARASLKLLVVQGVPSSSAAVVPPADTFTSNDERRASIPPITTDLSGGRHSQSGSISSGLGSESDLDDRRTKEVRRSQASSSSRSPLTGSISSISLPTPPPVVHASLNVPEARKGSLTPTVGLFQQAEAGPSRRTSDYSGFGFDMGMDEATRALIEQFQREEEEALRAEEERKRQLRLDEELARKEQQTEANEWQRQQMVQQEREREQIQRDEQRARDLAAEERRMEDSRRLEEQRELQRTSGERRGTADREQQFADERRHRRNQWHDSGRAARGEEEYSHQYPSVNPLFERQVYHSPPPDFSPDMSATMPPNPPTGFNRGYDEQAHAQGRLSDHRLQEVNGRRSGTMPQRQASRPPPGYGYGSEPLRPFTPSVHPSYQSLPPRSAHTPQPERSMPTPSTFVYNDRNIPFPSPQPRSSATWQDTSPPLARVASRPSSLHDDAPALPSPHTGTLVPRPSTFYDEQRARSRERSQTDWRRPSYRDVSPTDTSRSSYDPRLQPWIPGRHDSGDTASVAGTTISGMSESTLRPRSDDDDDSADTARAGDWTQQLHAMISQGRGPAPAGLADDEEEATLWLPRPTLGRAGSSKPMLTVDTGSSRDSAPSTDSATDSEGEGTRAQRGKSFARPEPNQWHTRPEPEQLYNSLEKFFPKIDVDKPFVETVPSTPSTPGESPSQPYPPPPQHPSRQTPETPIRNDIPRMPPIHPARSSFNKSENRKSIRNMADHKRKVLQKETPVEKVKDEMKLGRRMSMWGHRVVEVTASKLSRGQILAPTPETQGETDKAQPINWVKGQLIGKGSYGRVYIAMNLTTGDMIAVKQVELPATERDRNDSRQAGQIESLRQEIALLKDLYHPNIVAYLGFETSSEYLSIFLEYVPGGTIASIYRTPGQGQFEEQLVKFFTKQILEGLAYLHDQNIWHRDLKGDNILVDANGVCKISDFGISKQTEDAYDSFGAATNMKGSVFWMAPEVIQPTGVKSYSGKIDIWSLGCVVLEMWSGKRPWGDLEQVTAMMKIYQNEKPTLPEGLTLSPVALDFMDGKCLAPYPSQRPTAKELLEHRFITEVDRKWTFAESKIGRVVAQRGAVSIMDRN